jgi:hypothetical protein
MDAPKRLSAFAKIGPLPPSFLSTVTISMLMLSPEPSAMRLPYSAMVGILE